MALFASVYCADIGISLFPSPQLAPISYSPNVHTHKQTNTDTVACKPLIAGYKLAEILRSPPNSECKQMRPTILYGSPTYTSTVTKSLMKIIIRNAHLIYAVYVGVVECAVAAAVLAAFTYFPYQTP